jgi:putative lipoic acid-binding regulatory protein
MSEQDKPPTSEDCVAESLLEFPCDFEIKAMGLANDDFVATVLNLIKPYVAELDETRVKMKQSSNGKYSSITVPVWATSKAQLDTIYQALYEHESIKYML